MGGIDAVTLGEAHTFELLGGEKGGQFSQAALELRLDAIALGGGDFLILGAARKRLQRREPGMKRKQAPIISRSAEVGEKLRARIEELLVRQRALQQRRAAGRYPRRPDRR
ncbi:MAG TPA: hypothetical protein DHW63_01340 [Hyphomonadaceae bacterium]|nr:hypothetical protein [Hyphomonadaceae bacterium]